MSKKSYPNSSQNLLVEIAEDNLSAYLTIFESGEIINEKEIEDLLSEAGVCFGIDEAAAFNKKTNIPKEFGKPFVIALGKSTLASQIELSPLFDSDNCFDQAKFENDKTSLQGLEHISTNAPLADLQISQAGSQGKNVFGMGLGTDTAENELLLAYIGENVYYSGERQQIYARRPGYPYIDQEKRINVKNVIEIDAAQTADLPPLHIACNLVIHGDLINLPPIYAEGDITVHGSIERVSLEAEGDIIIKGDINDCKSPGIIAGGDVHFINAENSHILGGKFIKFNKNAHFCMLRAQEAIHGDEYTSSLVGGSAQAGQKLEAATIGNDIGIDTEIEITISPYTKERILLYTREMKKLKNSPEFLATKITDIEDKLVILEQNLEEQFTKILLEDEDIPKRINVFKQVYAGVSLRILKNSDVIRKDLSKVSFIIENGQLSREQY